ncbi:MAG: hypothetical protein M1828_006688 [Chrysothrix sp. TS-e1954]|nr:MAG: hypothetical protein M1828_006688 [Chrysothrix sp. TS-e1954]
MIVSRSCRTLIPYRHSPNLKLKLKLQPKNHITTTTSTAQVDNLITDTYATLRPTYAAPRNPILLAHGLLGFSSLHLLGKSLPGIHYWRGISEALRAHNVEVFTARVPAFAGIEERAAKLGEVVEEVASGRGVNVIAGLDARYMISRLPPRTARILSLTTISTPHRGSPAADHFLRTVSRTYAPLQSLKTPWTRPTDNHLWGKTALRLPLEHTALPDLTPEHMTSRFNPSTPDVPSVSYYSYGATHSPGFLSPFRHSHGVVSAEEGDNDGLVSVRSAKWGIYKGTLGGVSQYVFLPLWF